MSAQTPESLAVAVRQNAPAQGCSPEQIVGRLRRADPDDMQRQLSAETIYVSLYVLSRGAHC